MSTYKRISVRFNLDRLEHQKAWKVLSRLPDGRMNEYITSAILAADNKDNLRNMLVETMLEIMDTHSFKKSSASAIDEDAMNFLKNL